MQKVLIIYVYMFFNVPTTALTKPRKY